MSELILSQQEKEELFESEMQDDFVNDNDPEDDDDGLD